MDADHATLGHTTAWTNALARRADHVSVITMLAGRIAVEPNVTVYKNPRLLADAWRLVAPRVPGARLVVVGRGRLQPIVDDLVREFPDRVEAITRLSPPEVAALLDDSIALALSSESEGLPRVIMEAFAHGRAVVATSVGGIPDIVEPDRNGFLVHRGDAPALADALVRILGDRELAERLGRGARETARDLAGTPDRYAASVRRLVEQVLAET
jgi:glycosyltransferase involved in cell wall biosynthesis